MAGDEDGLQWPIEPTRPSVLLDPLPQFSVEMAQKWMDTLKDAVEMVWARRERELSFEKLYRLGYRLTLNGYGGKLRSMVHEQLRRGARSVVQRARYDAVIKLLNDIYLFPQMRAFAFRHNTVAGWAELHWQNATARACRGLWRLVSWVALIARCKVAWRAHQELRYRPGGLGASEAAASFEGHAKRQRVG